MAKTQLIQEHAHYSENGLQKQKVLTIGKKIQVGVKLFAISSPFILFIMELLGEQSHLCYLLLREI